MATLGEDINDLMSSVNRELAERERAEANYQLLFENHPEPMWVYDFTTLAFLEVNDAATKHYGYSRDEFLMMTIRDLRSTLDLPKLDLTLTSLEPISRSGP